MKVKKYIAKDLHEALRQVRSDLGPEAVIIQTKECEIRRCFGFVRRQGVEVTAGVGMTFLGDLVSKPRKVEEEQPAIIPVAPAQEPRIIPAPPALAVEREAPPTSVKAFGDDNIDERMKRLESSMAMIQESIVQIAQVKVPTTATPGYPPAVEQVYQRMKDQGLDEEFSRELLVPFLLGGNGRTVEDVERGVIETLASKIRCTGSLALTQGGSKTIVLIGPTGVGKTTTLAKISASFCLNRNKKVAMITTDTYRLAATDQLKRYADILGVTLDIVYSSEEMKQAVERRQDADMIFIDTAGRSQKNVPQMEELQTFLEATLPSQIHLLLSATTKYDDLLDLVNRFELITLDSLIITKIDESNSFGPVINLLRKVNLPVSYLTTGQNVPEDIEQARPERLAQLLVSG